MRQIKQGQGECLIASFQFFAGKFAWHSTINGATAFSHCPYAGNGYAQRDCTDEGTWDDEDTSRCLHKNMLTRQLDELSKVCRNLEITCFSPTVCS